ncbi:hypothetical protein Nepgr_023927 [Nepenthes gracilis]|uniref:Uncharacterized protein n=1 Tax=Nepenthes gracilis TaxID=150966 RepID=A0AAD3T3X7_NEPGR|nr:hypothetical protein Nepgr_023927 [Nepenthes gracilis]
MVLEAVSFATGAVQSLLMILLADVISQADWMLCWKAAGADFLASSSSHPMRFAWLWRLLLLLMEQYKVLDAGVILLLLLFYCIDPVRSASHRDGMASIDQLLREDGPAKSVSVGSGLMSQTPSPVAPLGESMLDFSVLALTYISRRNGFKPLATTLRHPIYARPWFGPMPLPVPPPCNLSSPFLTMGPLDESSHPAGLYPVKELMVFEVDRPEAHDDADTPLHVYQEPMQSQLGIVVAPESPFQL